jgi:hypothetical protein
MARFVFVTFEGGGNQPPALGIAQELRERGHEVVFAGYESQRSRFTARGFRFVLLERSQAALEQVGLWEGVLVCAPQLQEVPEVFARERAAAVAVDCMLFAALTACERARLPTGVVVHSPPGAVLHPHQILARRVPPPLNALRATIGLGPLDRLWENWRGMTVLCTSIRELDPLAEAVPPAFDYVGPVFERVPPSGWRAPWARDDARPLVCLPVPWVADQPPLAAQLERLGAGRDLDGELATPAEIAAAVDAVLVDPAYRASAGELARAIAAKHGAVTAAARLERLVADAGG